MNRTNQYVAIAGLAIIATLLFVPLASAATPPDPTLTGLVNSIKTIVTDIQTKVGWILTNVTSAIPVLTDVQVKAGWILGNVTSAIPMLNDVQTKVGWVLGNLTGGISDIRNDISSLNATVNEINATVNSIPTTQGSKVVSGAGAFILDQGVIANNDPSVSYGVLTMSVSNGTAGDFKISVMVYYDDWTTFTDFTDAVGDRLTIIKLMGLTSAERKGTDALELLDTAIPGWHEVSFTGCLSSMYVHLEGTIPNRTTLVYSWTITTSPDAVVVVQQFQAPLPPPPP